MAHSERQVAALTHSLESLMREKKDLELKERIMRDSLTGITEHMDHLFAHKVSLPHRCPSSLLGQQFIDSIRCVACGATPEIEQKHTSLHSSNHPA